MNERPALRTLRLSTDDDGNSWIDEQDSEGEWTRLDTAEPLRVGETRRLDSETLRVIANAVDHPQKQLAEEALGAVKSFAGAPSRELLETLRERFNQPVAPSDPLEVDDAKRKFKIPPSKPAMDPYLTLADLEPVSDPTYEVIGLFEEQNRILAEQRDDAKEAAAASELHAARNLKIAWAAIGVTVVVGIVQIVLTAIQMAQG